MDLIDSPQIKKLPSKIFKDRLTNQDLDEKDIICLFTQEWREYFTSLRNRLHTIPLMYFFPNLFLDKNRLSEEWISSALNDVTWEDRLDVSKMSKLSDKDWVCWERDYDWERDHPVYRFQEDAWKELETLYSFVSGCKERASPFASTFEIDIDDDRDESRRVIGNIQRYLA